MSLKVEVAKLRKVLEDNNWNMSSVDIGKLTLVHIKLLKNIDSKIKMPLVLNGQVILNDIIRIVTGAHGSYFEFKEEHLAIPIEITKGQEWRTTPKYHYVKYTHLNPIGIPDIKIYNQKKTVKYANYKPDHMYIDCWLDWEFHNE